MNELQSRHKRDISEFVSRAIARELVQEARDEYIAAAEKEHPTDEAMYETFLRLITT
jgi:hypothetical protein